MSDERTPAASQTGGESAAPDRRTAAERFFARRQAEKQSETQAGAPATTGTETPIVSTAETQSPVAETPAENWTSPDLPETTQELTAPPESTAPDKAAPAKGRADSSLTGRALRRQLDEDIEAELEAAMAGFDANAMLPAPSPPPAAKPADGAAAADPNRRQARVLKITSQDVFVDLGETSEGVVSAQSFGDKLPAVGDRIELVVDRYDSANDLYLLRRPGTAQEADWGTVAKGMIVDAQVKKVNKGGLEVTVNGLRGFMPAGMVDVDHIADFSSLVGQTLRCEVVEVKASERNLVVSRRVVLERERAEKAQQTLASLEVGQVRDGVVRRLMDYGAFVDIGGVDGLLHVGQMSWSRINHPREVVDVGHAVKVTVLSFEPDTKKISLGLRQLTPSPWTQAAIKFPVGAIVPGRVTRLADFGVFVELEPGIEGLIHISEMSHQRIRRVGDIVREGESVEVKVTDVDTEKQRIGLSLKQAIPQEEPQTGSQAEQTEPEAAPEPPKPKRSTKPLKGGLGGTQGPLFG